VKISRNGIIKKFVQLTTKKAGADELQLEHRRDVFSVKTSGY